MAYTVEQFRKFLEMMVGQPYWYGTCVHRCTNDMLNQKTKQYPKHYATGRMPVYRAAITAKRVSADCVGLIKGFWWTNGGEGVKDYLDGKVKTFKNSYASNNVPDVNADGLLAYFKKKGCKSGKLNTLPERMVAVFRSGHVGVYVGDGWVIEGRGFKYGCQKNRIKERDFTDWADFPTSWLTPQTSPAKPTPEPVKPIPTPEPENTYKVKSGDSLWAIAKNFLGDGNRWKEIALLNKISGTIIKVGQVLKIPNK